MIGIIDYGRGNLHSAVKAVEYVGGEASLVDQPRDLCRYRGIIVPGVGAFADATTSLEQSGMGSALVAYAQSGRPILGICLGMQVLLSQGHEGGKRPGLGLIGGQVRPLPTQVHRERFRVPHTGWNRVRFLAASPLSEGLTANPYFYFVHSYAAFPTRRSDWLGETLYGQPFASAVNRGNVYGVQFHPEKSGPAGLRVLFNFIGLSKG